jgi:hypothetical protein
MCLSQFLEIADRAMDSKSKNAISNQERHVPAPVWWYGASFLAARLRESHLRKYVLEFA